MTFKQTLRDSLITLAALAAAFALSIEFQRLDVEEHITTIFVFAVFAVSLLTRGYVYGLAAAVAGTVAVNFAFTYPYFVVDFLDPVNAVSAVIMVSMAVITTLLVKRVKQHEAAKAESQRERMRANLLRAVSHDLRTPLTTICSAGSLLRQGGLSPRQQDALLQSIQEDAQWLMRLVENLLTVTRIDNDTMRITTTPTILDELIDSAVSRFAGRHPDRRIELSLPEEIVVIPMDATLIEQVLLNLLENAVYHARGMTVLSLRVFTLGRQVIFEIADDGCGIDAALLRQLLEGSGSLPQDRRAEGDRFAGIGLSVCATIIRAHGGSITAENRRGGGALFRFTLEKEAPHDQQPL